jgi:hypothetical protein
LHQYFTKYAESPKKLRSTEKCRRNVQGYGFQCRWKHFWDRRRLPEPKLKPFTPRETCKFQAEPALGAGSIQQ